jgi:DNA-binding NarL/FixJ family response regulator
MGVGTVVEAGRRHVLLVDDHAPTLTAIACMLEHEQPEIEVIGMARDGAGALQFVRDSSPDVVVLDLDLAGESALELIPALVLKHGVAVIIFTSADDPLTRKRGFSAGAVAFVSKYAPVDELISAIKATRPRLMGMGGLSRPPRTFCPHK